MTITIITSENRRLYPAIVYSLEDKEKKNPILDIDDIYDLLYKKQNILVISAQFDQYGKELKIFNGELGKSDIKALFTAEDVKAGNPLESVMTLSEAAKKWGLSNGSTIRKAIERGKFEHDEIKQAGDVWIITYSAMERVFGSIKNEEEAYVIYDDFESIYMSKAYWEYAELHNNTWKSYVYVIDKHIEIKYQYIRDICIKSLEALRNGQKLIIRDGRSEQIKQIIEKAEELYIYVELFVNRKILSEEFKDKLLNDLKSIPNNSCKRYL